MSPEMFSPFKKVSTRSGAFLPNNREELSGAIPPLPHTPSWRGQKELYHSLYVFFFNLFHSLSLFLGFITYQTAPRVLRGAVGPVPMCCLFDQGALVSLS